MSFEAMGFALTAPVFPPTAKLVLIMMADNADHNNCVLPNVPKLADRTNIPEIIIGELVERMISRGVLKRTTGEIADGSLSDKLLQFNIGWEGTQ